MNESLKSSLSEIEAQWESVAANTIATMMAEKPGEDFYAAAFWLFALDGQHISPPAFAINSESGVTEPDSYGEDNRWNPADWRQSVIMTAHDAMTPAYLVLSEQLQGEDWSVWEDVAEAQKQAIARVCRNLTAAVRSEKPPFDSAQVNPDFVVGIIDGRDSEEELQRLVRLSIDPAIIESLNIPFLD